MASAASVLGITSIFGQPRDPRTWSSAPANVATALEGQGLEIVGIDVSMGRLHYTVFAGAHLLTGLGRFRYSEAIARGPSMRRYRARKLARELRRLGIERVLHTGTLDMAPVPDDTGVTHYLFCDHTWHLSLQYRPDAADYSAKAIREFDDLECAAYQACHHVFTFGEYVRQDLISHYGMAEYRVSAVGSGMGRVKPYAGAKDYAGGRLLFIAKHLFTEKGGDLLIEAFRLAVRERPDLTLIIVGNEKAVRKAAGCPNVEVRPFVPWEELESLLQQAAILVQPMLNDPWGQVYLEALASRTPVIGLRRNGLPEITQDGRFGFLVDKATPHALAEAIVEAASRPERLAEMGTAGQQHVLRNYSWDIVGQRMFDVIEGWNATPRKAA
ncbi:glycosyltransferase family 4 protein [Shumkonia mesophila]|uniref:glycosyltransferase family 4 protein n=1 Tax=Shumkonia mesophila TaxID=2838854 RepID=UPI00293447A4|nr:glycosyltransferase family 4 protein [Shumkonia mesophila]